MKTKAELLKQLRNLSRLARGTKGNESSNTKAALERTVEKLKAMGVSLDEIDEAMADITEGDPDASHRTRDEPEPSSEPERKKQPSRRSDGYAIEEVSWQHQWQKSIVQLAAQENGVVVELYRGEHVLFGLEEDVNTAIIVINVMTQKVDMYAERNMKLGIAGPVVNQFQGEINKVLGANLFLQGLTHKLTSVAKNIYMQGIMDGVWFKTFEFSKATTAMKDAEKRVRKAQSIWDREHG